MEKSLPNVFDTLQSASRTLTQHAVPALTAALPLIIVLALLITTLQNTLVADLSRDLAFSAARERMSIGSTIALFAIGILNFVLQIAFLGFVFTAAYSMATGATSRGEGFKLGTGDSPLFKLTIEQDMVIRSSIKKILLLWPALIAGLAAALATMISTQINVMTFGGLGGDAPEGAVLAMRVLQIVAWFFWLWTIARLIRFFLFRPAVVVETGTLDEAKITEYLDSKFPRCLLSKTFWYLTGVIIIGLAFPMIIWWVWSGVIDLVRFLGRGFLGGFLGEFIGFAAWVLAGVFVAGAIAFIRTSENQGASAPAPASPASDPASDTPQGS